MKLSQHELEKKVFQRFMKHSDMNCTSVKICVPPRPDILCTCKNQKVYFELTDNTSHQIQKSVHARDDVVRDQAYSIDPFPAVYNQKFNKSYETDSLRCDLLVYFGMHPVKELDEHFEHRLHENIEWIGQNIHRSIFHRVWIYDYHQDAVIGRVG